MSLKDQIITHFSEKSEKLFAEILGQFKKKSSDLILENSGWGEQVMIH